MIRVLLVDDCPVAIAVLKRLLARSADLSVVGVAENGQVALEMIPRTKPDVICTDLHMPVMNGLQFTREVMARFPLPILLVSVSGHRDSRSAFEVLDAGAVDLFAKPPAGSAEEERVAQALIAKIRILSGVHVFRRASPAGSAATGGGGGFPGPPVATAGVGIIAIGASTGGPDVLRRLLARMGSRFPLPVVCVQHIADGFSDGLIEWLSSPAGVGVRKAVPGERPAAGVVYFPEEGAHLRIGPDGRFTRSGDPPVDGHRPSITLMMESLAARYGSRALGILLTGMGSDGVAGLRAIARGGGKTIAQDEASCVVFGMPRRAIELGAAQYVLPVEGIARVIDALAGRGGARRGDGGDGLGR